MEEAHRPCWARRFLGVGWFSHHSSCGHHGDRRRLSGSGSDKLRDEDVREARVHTALAGHLGDESSAKASLTSTDPSTRRLAISALARLNSLTTSDLQAALDDPDSSVRRKALEIAAKRSDVDAKRHLSDSDPSVAETAAFAIGEQLDISATEPLMLMARQHEDALCRESAIAALGALVSLGKIHRDAILDCLIDAMGDKPQIRRRAVLGLSQFEEPRAQQTVEKALLDKDRQVRSVAADLLGGVAD